jgi:glucuronate isomerase
VLCTTDAASDPLAAHQKIRASGWSGEIRPTFRPDNLTNLLAPGWQEYIAQLSQVSGVDITSYASSVSIID